MKNVYISDVISVKDIESWHNEEMITITAPTGSGKSTFIKDKLFSNANLNNRKILLLTNRDLLKEQFDNDLSLREHKDIITIMNYQEIEKKILYQREMQELNIYDYIVCDEFHYFFNDSSFNNTTDLSFEWVLNQSNKIRIFMSATAELTINYLSKHKKYKIKNYSLPKKYGNIEELYFYDNDDVLMKMLTELPKDEKALYFTSAEKAYKASKELEDASFICSKYNKKYSQYIDKDIRQQIVDEYKFNCQILCSTTTLDNGVSIKDESLKHIIVDVFEPDIIEQCIGRKRIEKDTDKIKIYIKNWNGRALSGKMKSIDDKIEYARIIIHEGTESLINKYPRRNYGAIIYDFINENGNLDKRVNSIMYYKYLDNICLCEVLLKDRKKIGYIKFIAKKFGFTIKTSQYLEDYYDGLVLEDKLEKLVGVKMFDEEQKAFKDYINENVIKVIKGSKDSLGYKTINNRFEDLGVNYVIKSDEEKSRKNPNRGKRYWMIYKLVS